MKKIYLIIFLLIFPFWVTLAQDDCTLKTWFEQYKCRTKNICENYKTNQVVFNTESFKKAEDYENEESWFADILFVTDRQEKPLKNAVAIYKENMNNVYKCAIINSQLNSIKVMKDKVLKLDKVWDLRKSMEPKINSLVQKLELTANTSNCSNTNKKIVYNKLNILKQTTYLTCDYNYYMEYLKWYYTNLEKTLWIDQLTDEQKKEYYTVPEVANIQKGIFMSIDSEVEQAYKTFPIAYQAYSEFENNFPIHFLLEIVKEDFTIFRDKLYQTLSPINQVVYKISNAMKVR